MNESHKECRIHNLWNQVIHVSLSDGSQVGILPRQNVLLKASLLSHHVTILRTKGAISVVDEIEPPAPPMLITPSASAPVAPEVPKVAKEYFKEDSSPSSSEESES